MTLLLAIGLTFVLMTMIVAAMTVGVLFGRAPISGTCGGMRRLAMDTDCDICGGDPSRCEPPDV